MNMRPRTNSLIDVCGFNRSGRALVHKWAPPEALMIRSVASGEGLRLSLTRCKRCDAFVLRSHGGDVEALEELLEFARPVGAYLGWCSPEQPGHEHCSPLPPRRKRRKQRTPRKRREAA